jgi:hypothetical protein
MKSIFFAENREGDWHIGYYVDGENEISAFRDERLSLMSEKIKKTEYFKLTPLYQKKQAGQMYILINPSKKTTGYIKSKSGTSVTDYSLFGTGIIGIPNIINAPKINHILLKNPLNLSTKNHSELFQITSRKTLIYFKTGFGKESIVTGWNFIYNSCNKPVYERGNQKIKKVINPRDVDAIRSMWNDFYNSENKLVPSPVFFFLKKLGFDGIIDRYNNIAISISSVSIEEIEKK